MKVMAVLQIVIAAMCLLLWLLGKFLAHDESGIAGLLMTLYVLRFAYIAISLIHAVIQLIGWR